MRNNAAAQAWSVFGAILVIFAACLTREANCAGIDRKRHVLQRHNGADTGPSVELESHRVKYKLTYKVYLNCQDGIAQNYYEPYGNIHVNVGLLAENSFELWADDGHGAYPNGESVAASGEEFFIESDDFLKEYGEYNQITMSGNVMEWDTSSRDEVIANVNEKVYAGILSSQTKTYKFLGEYGYYAKLELRIDETS